jgi:excisionase family DNA binding protein
MTTNQPFSATGQAVPSPSSRSGHAIGPSRRLISLAEAAELLGMSIPSVRRLIWSGKLHVVKLNRRVLVDLRDLDRLIDQAKDRASW